MKRTDLAMKLRPILLVRRDRLRRSLSGELSLLGGKDESFEDDIFAHLSFTESRELAAIDQALERMQEESYGLCEECGGSIPLSRIHALPFATTCVQCQSQSEHTVSNRRAREPVSCANQKVRRAKSSVVRPAQKLLQK